MLLFATPALAAPTHIAASLAVESTAAPGGHTTIAIVMRPEPGWHGYWVNPGDAGFGMKIDWTLPAGATLATLQYPVPETLTISGLMNHVYNHDYALLAELTVPAGATPGAPLPVSAEASWLACTDTICVPEHARLATEVRVGAPVPADPRFAAWRVALPAPLGAEGRFAIDGGTLRLAIPLPAAVPLARPHLFAGEDRVVDYAAPQRFARTGDWLLVTLARAKLAPATPSTFTGVLLFGAGADGVAFTARPGILPTGGTPLGDGGAPSPGRLAALLLAALAGGLLLNIMPCVFPILSLKALSLARAGESARGARIEGLAYATGVILACLALGGLMLALRAGGEEIGWAFQLQEPLVVAALLALAAVITANLAGLFEFAVPGFVQSPARPDHGAAGAFLTGLLAAFVATPCTGPFMATAMGAALLLPLPAALALFAALGLGIALPFVALAFIPPLRRLLPRPGAWMNRFRRAMAVPMGLTVLALAWLAGRLAGTGFMLAALALALALLLALGWAGRRQRAGESAATGLAVAIILVTAGAAVALPPLRGEPTREASSLPGTIAFSDAALARARASGRPVFAWFTADWCLTCKVNERVAIETDATRAAFARAGVVTVRGDWTRRDPAITRFLGAHGAAGVPLYVWYPARGEGRALPQVLTPGTLPALAGAGARGSAAAD